jgi:ABC-type branched-subunit amino acid transport system ATPase component/ABC-type branched-subunit amino acid transport system permease subunit
VNASLAVLVDGQIVFTGVIAGLVYGVLGVGLLLVYRSSGVINFAYGQMGALAATLVAKMTLDWGWNFWASLAVAMIGGALLGAVVEITVVRRLSNAPRVILFIATLGVAQLVLVMQIELPKVTQDQPFPSPLHVAWEISGIFVDGRQLLALIMIPLATVLLTLFLTRSRTGRAIRAAAANPDAARLAGVRPQRMSTIVWAISGALAALTAVLIVPLLGLSAGTQIGDALGASLLVRALAAVLIARFVSLPLTLLGGVLIGIAEAVVLANVDPASSGLMNTPGIVDVLLFLFILVAMLFISRQRRGGKADETWSFAPRVKPIPQRLSSLRGIRWSTRIAGPLAIAIAAMLPLVITRPSSLFLWTQVVVYAAIALSVVLLTGFAGQLSLSQFAFCGLGALTTAALVAKDVSFLPAVMLACAACVIAALLVGAPALRLQGLFLAITTLAFSVACSDYFFGRPIFLGSSLFTTVYMPRQEIGPLDLTAPRAYYYVCLAFLIIVFMFVKHIRRSGIGRSFIGVRTNEANAAAFGLSPARVKLTAFGISGGLAGFAGALLGGLLVSFGPADFTLAQSIRIVSIAVIGGIATPAGAVLGALWVIGLPALLGHDDTVALLTSSIGLLVLLMYFPGGLAQIFISLRDRALEIVASRQPRAAEPAGRVRTAPAVATGLPSADRVTAGQHDPVLRTVDLQAHFGGVIALDEVSITVGANEIVGLIGANGAGKTTLMNAIGGYVPSTGTVELCGVDISKRSPSSRARLGLGRAFQNAALFSDLTVTEVVMLACEVRERTRFSAALLGLPSERRAERRKRRHASDLIELVGLEHHRDLFVSQLSTGTRRICELACLLALRTPLLLLDEPTAGIAQRESEAFGPLLARIQSESGCSMLVIEHDMPMVMGLTSRIYCLDRGAVIAEGTPEQVRLDPLVVAAYLGTDDRAINRSDAR